MESYNTLLGAIADASQTLPPPEFGQIGAAMINLMGGVTKKDVVMNVINKACAENEISEGAVTAGKGFLVSSDELQNIFLYIDAALRLPQDRGSAERYLGYKSDDEFFKEESHKFLSPDNEVEFDKPIILHAEKWADLEQSIKNLGNSLNTYSHEFVLQAEEVLEVLEDLNKYLRIKGFVDKEGREIVECGMDMLSNWEKNTGKYKEDSEKLYKRLTDFDRELETNIKPGVLNRIENISNIKLNDELVQLNAKVANLKKEIEDLQKEYDKQVGLAFTGASGMIIPPLGVISWAVTGGVYGAKAEKTRKKKNSKKDELDNLQKKVNAINSIIGRINELQNKLTSFEGAISAAIIGVQHINTIWDSIICDIKGALQHISNISNEEYVRYVKGLISELKIAKQDWEHCGDITKELVTQFDNARVAFDKRCSQQAL